MKYALQTVAVVGILMAGLSAVPTMAETAISTTATQTPNNSIALRGITSGSGSTATNVNATVGSGSTSTNVKTTKGRALGRNNSITSARVQSTNRAGNLNNGRALGRVNQRTTTQANMDMNRSRQTTSSTSQPGTIQTSGTTR